jgi:hypothetical protein
MNDRGLREFGADTTGFGAIELKTLWHSLRRPVAVLDAYMTEGPTGGGRYARPLRLYLTLCGVLMIVQFLMGGMDAMLAGALPPEAIEPLLERSGKSYDAFMADADGWGSLFMVPLGAAAYALIIAPVLRWWDPDNLGWRKAFRAGFAYLNLWTLFMLPVGWLVYLDATSAMGAVLMPLLGVLAFIMMGRGRWWRTLPGCVGKAISITLITFLTSLLSLVPLFTIAVLGATYGP